MSNLRLSESALHVPTKAGHLAKFIRRVDGFETHQGTAGSCQT